MLPNFCHEVRGVIPFFQSGGNAANLLVKCCPFLGADEWFPNLGVERGEMLSNFLG